MSDVAIFLFALSLLAYRRRELSGSHTLTFFLLLIAFTIFISTEYSGLVDARGFEAGIPNAVAVPFGVLLSLLCVWLMDSGQVLRIASSYSRVVVSMCCCFFLGQLFIGPLDWVIYENQFDRFSAFSQNPNQLALYLAPVPFFSLIACAKNLKGRWSAAIEIALGIAINLFVLGKALFIGWGLSAVILFLLGWVWFGAVHFNEVKFFGRALLSLVLSGIFWPVIVALYKGDVAGSQADQGDIRVKLWGHGFEAWTDSIFVGHGPGHYSGLEASYQNMEAHNFLIDWLSAYGLLGGIALTLYCAWLLFYSVRRRAWLVLALYVTLLVQATFHFYGRQPLFWILLVFGYFIASSSTASRRISD